MSLKLETGKQYLTKSGHIFTAMRLVEEPNTGTQMLGTIEGPNGPQMELYDLDGSYRKDHPTDWDIVKEAEVDLSFEAGKIDGLFDRNGRKVYPHVEVKAHVQAKNVPVIQFSHSPEEIEGYVRYSVRSNQEIDAAKGIAAEKLRRE